MHRPPSRYVADLTDLADRAHNPGDRRLLSALARRDVLPGLLRRYPDHPVPINAAYRCREQLATAVRLLDVLQGRSRHLEMARELPPAVVGQLLGLQPVTAARWAETGGGNWARYATDQRPAT